MLLLGFLPFIAGSLFIKIFFQFSRQKLVTVRMKSIKKSVKCNNKTLWIHTLIQAERWQIPRGRGGEETKSSTGSPSCLKSRSEHVSHVDTEFIQCVTVGEILYSVQTALCKSKTNASWSYKGHGKAWLGGYTQIYVLTGYHRGGATKTCTIALMPGTGAAKQPAMMELVSNTSTKTPEITQWYNHKSPSIPSKKSNMNHKGRHKYET